MTQRTWPPSRGSARALLSIVCASLLLSASCGPEPGGADAGGDAGEAAELDAGSPSAVNPHVPSDCTVGTLECACAPGGGCALDPDGNQLNCVAGVCLLPACPPGALGCPCRPNGSCTDGECVSGMCALTDCVPGTLHCGCVAGGCDVGLLCQEGALCVDERGHEGGACLDNGSCHPGNRCDPSNNRCVHCAPGSAGCQCTASGGCGSGLSCSAGTCVSSAEVPPENPRCYSPCRGDLVTGSETRLCGVDNLMSGCLDEQVCTDGSCLLPGQPKPPCQTDLDCPFFQTCLEGGCYSNCETTLDCPSGTGCHDRVCRVPCQLVTGTSSCPSAQTCDSSDGETGFCVPIRPPEPVVGAIEQGAAFTVKAEATVQLTNLATGALIRVTPKGTTTQQITVRKLSHRLRLPDGRVETVDTPIDETTGEPLACAGASTECPLWWLQMGDLAGGAAGNEYTFTLPGGCDEDCPPIVLRNAGGSPGVTYEGRLAIMGPGGTHEVGVQYFEDVSGRWTGQVHFFTNFPDTGLSAWASSANKDDVDDVRNGLLQRWGAFRRGNLEGFDELEAVLTATRTGSWKQPQVQSLCDAVTGGSSAAVCYPYSNPEGVRRYVQNKDLDPIPGETTELPIAFNLRTVDGGGTVLTGRIDSDIALQYPNNPALSLQLVNNPALPGACDPDIPSACVVFLKSMRADIAVGARYIGESDDCAPGFVPKTVPWLVPELYEGTHGGLGVVRTECRDASLPYDDVTLQQLNADLAGANPVPDGATRKRKLELLDGALIDQRKLVILFRESFPSFLPASAPVNAYGFMVLTRSPADLDDEDFVGTTAPDVARAAPAFGARCAEPIDDAEATARRLLDGSAADPGLIDPVPMSDSTANKEVHYLCAGRFDGGGGLEEATVDPFGGADPPVGSGYVRQDGTLYLVTPSECLPGNEITFFYIDTTRLTPRQVHEDPCNDSGTCRARLNEWVSNGSVADASPVWGCQDPSRVICHDDLTDLRVGKLFYEKLGGAPSSARVLAPIEAAVDSAFRFKTRFVSGLDDDLEVGFAPVPCIPGSDQFPYCYSGEEVEETRDRVDCLLDLYTNRRGELTAATQARVDAFLRGSFSETSEQRDGFERMYAELVVMLGDEELTGAFASRFDLAGVDTDNFEGVAFEVDGINLSGVAGAEMSKLYRAISYYQLALDRFYRMGPHFKRALNLGDTSSPINLISPQTVTLYLPRVVRAMAQKALAYAEVARRYQTFNRPDIARRVLQRAYAQTYLESVLLGRMMLDISERSQDQFKDQMDFELQSVQRTLRVALLDMREVFEEVSRGSTYFGFPPEYVPFPAVDSDDVGANGFEILLNTARTKLSTAKEREQIAFDSLIQSRLDVAQFQGELVRVRNNHEDQLEDLCGAFTGDDGVRYPAIRKYAARGDLARALGDPCGLFPNGRIYEQMLQVDAATAALDGILTRYRNAREDIRDEQTRVAAQCNLLREQARFEYEQGAAVRDLETALGVTQTAVNGVVRGLNLAKEAVNGYAECMVALDSVSKGICATLRTGAVGFGVATAVLETASEGVAVGFQAEIATKRLETGRWITENQCQVQLVDAARTMAQMVRGLDEITLEALRAQVELQLQVAEVARMQNEADRLQERQAEAEQHLIDVEAARNDPNTRIFRNESIINADIAFNDTIRAAYRATRMYEYYTSTSYAGLEQLFIIRLAAKGTLNLENYLIDLENAFSEFEESFGVPDARVAIYSLRDDILQVPFLDERGEPLSQADRIARMVEMLRDPNRLDTNGYITIPFGTGFEQLSPLTRNHKVRYVEANIIGSNVGDRLGRLYLRQRGTSQIKTVDSRSDYYVFPPRTAVVDAFFNGNRVLPPEVYRNQRLRDRPVVNTMWELVINKRDEGVNADIDLTSLSDIQLLVYYTDFTVF